MTNSIKYVTHRVDGCQRDRVPGDILEHVIGETNVYPLKIILPVAGIIYGCTWRELIVWVRQPLLMVDWLNYRRIAQIGSAYEPAAKPDGMLSKHLMK